MIHVYPTPVWNPKNIALGAQKQKT